jgi:hypothetical protein
MKYVIPGLMTAFISLVIIAGFFGPYVISIILMILSVLCLAVMNRPRPCR